MLPSLSDRLVYLRKQMGVSQKEASSKLQISHALLSHYERGIRECGLNFLVRAADFYGVSVDFLLGRSMEKKSNQTDNDTVEDDKRLKGSITAALASKLMANSIHIIFDLVDKFENKELLNQTIDYFSLAIYKYFRYIHEAGGNTQGLFNLPGSQFPLSIDIETLRCELISKNIIEGQSWQGSSHTPIDCIKLPVINHEFLSSTYPQQYSSLLNVLNKADKRTLKK